MSKYLTKLFLFSLRLLDLRIEQYGAFERNTILGQVQPHNSPFGTESTCTNLPLGPIAYVRYGSAVMM